MSNKSTLSLTEEGGNRRAFFMSANFQKKVGCQ